MYKGNIKKDIDNNLVNKFIDEIAAQRQVAQKAQEHVDRLLNLLEALKK